jgi:hypothetical protein
MFLQTRRHPQIPSSIEELTMPIADFIERFWQSIAILAVVVLLSAFSIVYAVRKRPSSSPDTSTAEERSLIRYLKAGTTVAVVLSWIGAFIVATDSPVLVNGTINWSLFNGDTRYGDTNHIAVAMLGVVIIGLPVLCTAFWIQLLRHNWPDAEGPSASTYILNYSLWLALIWSKILIGW